MPTYLRTYTVSDVCIFEDSPTGFKLAYEFLSKQCNNQRGDELQLRGVNYRTMNLLGICRHVLSQPGDGCICMPEKDILFRVSGKYLVKYSDSHIDGPHLCETCVKHFKPVRIESASNNVNMMLPWPSVEELIKEYYPTDPSVVVVADVVDTNELKRKESTTDGDNKEEESTEHKKQKC